MDVVHAFVTLRIRTRNIKIWCHPFYDKFCLAQELHDESTYDRARILTSLLAIQDHAIRRLTTKILTDDVPSPLWINNNLDLLQEPVPAPGLFDVTQIKLNRKSARFILIDRSFQSLTTSGSSRKVIPKICDDFETIACDLTVCANAKQFIECTTCPEEECKNRRVQKSQLLPPNNFEVVHDCDKGLTLYTKVNIKKGTLIGEYVGEIVSQAEYDSRAPGHDEEDFNFGFQLNDDFVVDASQYGNLMRFLSHSCFPNLTADVWRVNEERRVIFTANSDIKAGQELHFDYGGRFRACDLFMCRCGAPRCRNSIGGDYDQNRKAYTCYMCDLVFKNHESMVNHRSKDHPAPEKCKCPQCGKTLARPENLRAHIRNIHPADITQKRKVGRPRKDPSLIVVQEKKPRGRPRKVKAPTEPKKRTRSKKARMDKSNETEDEEEEKKEEEEEDEKEDEEEDEQEEEKAAASPSAAEEGNVLTEEDNTSNRKKQKRMTKTSPKFAKKAKPAANSPISYNKKRQMYRNIEKNREAAAAATAAAFSSGQMRKSARLATQNIKLHRESSSEDEVEEEEEEKEKDTNEEVDDGEGIESQNEADDNDENVRDSSNSDGDKSTVSAHSLAHDKVLQIQGSDEEQESAASDKEDEDPVDAKAKEGEEELSVDVEAKEGEEVKDDNNAKEKEGEEHNDSLNSNEDNRNDDSADADNEGDSPQYSHRKEHSEIVHHIIDLGPVIQGQTEAEVDVNRSSSMAFACMLCSFVGDSELSAFEHARQHTAVHFSLE